MDGRPLDEAGLDRSRGWLLIALGGEGETKLSAEAGRRLLAL